MSLLNSFERQIASENISRYNAEIQDDIISNVSYEGISFMNLFERINESVYLNRSAYVENVNSLFISGRIRLNDVGLIILVR